MRAVRVECRLDVDRAEIHGRVGIDLANPTAAPLDRVYLWLYPNRLARVPPRIDDVSFYWLYPRRHRPGSMSLERVALEQGGRVRDVPATRWRAEPHAAAGPGVLWSIHLPAPLAPGATVRLTAAYRAHVPERYGSFGCVDRRCTLAGGFYPMPAALDATGWDLAAAPPATQLEVSVELARPGSIVLFDQWSGNAASRLHVRAPAAPYATLITAPRHYESRRRVDGADMRFLSPDPPPPADDAGKVLLPYISEDYAAKALDTATAAAALLRDMGLPARALTMVSVPLRFELASAHEHVVLVSDRFFRIWPAERFRKFHRRQLARAVFAHQLMPRLAGRPHAEADDAADLVASYLTDLFVMRRYDKAEFIQNILRPVSFVPSIDQLLYAPQTMFADAYFGDLAGSPGDPLRDDPRRFMHMRPHGRLYYEKLRDLIGPARLDRAMRAVLTTGTDHRSAAEAAGGAPLGWFFRQWSLPQARVNYRLVSHRARPLRSGQFENQVVVGRDVDPEDRPPIEPVTVLAADEDGDRHRLRWSGGGPAASLRYISSSPIESAWVDPDGRVQESSVKDPSRHPRYDNRDRQPLRFVYNNLGLLFNVTDLSALIAVDFTLSRVYDVQNQFRFAAYTSASVRYGGLVSYERSFGRQVTPDRLLGDLTLTLGAARLDEEFFTAGTPTERPASQLSLAAGIGRNTEVFEFEPLHKHTARLYASLTGTLRDAVSDAPADFLLSGTVGSSTTRTITPAAGHTLAGEIRVAAALGDIESRSQLLAAGGAAGLRGFAPAGLFGRALASVRGEYRHTFVHDLDWNFGHYDFVRGFGGIAFVDTGVLTPCDSYLPDGRESFYASLGYGLQVFYDSFGTIASVMRVDAAARVLGKPQPCLGDTPARGPAVQLYITFFPPF